MVSTRTHIDRSLIFDAHVGVTVPMIIAMFLVNSTQTKCSRVLYAMCDGLVCWNGVIYEFLILMLATRASMIPRANNDKSWRRMTEGGRRNNQPSAGERQMRAVAGNNKSLDVHSGLFFHLAGPCSL